MKQETPNPAGTPQSDCPKTQALATSSPSKSGAVVALDVEFAGLPYEVLVK